MISPELMYMFASCCSFLIGYLFCRTTYFLGSIKTSILIVRQAQVVALSLIVLGLENYSASKTYRVLNMKKGEVSDKEISEYNKLFHNEYEYYKTKAIKDIVNLHPPSFVEAREFKDWNSAMMLTHFLCCGYTRTRFMTF